MGDKKRPSKKIPRYELEEVEYIRNGVSEFISVKKLAFELTKKQKELIKILHENKIITSAPSPYTILIQNKGNKQINIETR